MKKAPTHLRIDAYTFILLMIHFEKLKVCAYFDNSFLYKLSIHIAPKGAVIKIDITATVRTISPQDSPITRGTVPSAACTVAFGV